MRGVEPSIAHCASCIVRRRARSLARQVITVSRVGAFEQGVPELRGAGTPEQELSRSRSSLSRSSLSRSRSSPAGRRLTSAVACVRVRARIRERVCDRMGIDDDRRERWERCDLRECKRVSGSREARATYAGLEELVQQAGRLQDQASTSPATATAQCHSAAPGSMSGAVAVQRQMRRSSETEQST